MEWASWDACGAKTRGVGGPHLHEGQQDLLLGCLAEHCDLVADTRQGPRHTAEDVLATREARHPCIAFEGQGACQGSVSRAAQLPPLWQIATMGFAAFHVTRTARQEVLLHHEESCCRGTGGFRRAVRVMSPLQRLVPLRHSGHCLLAGPAGVAPKNRSDAGTKPGIPATAPP